MENVNRLLLENVLPAHVAAHFIGDKLNEVWWSAARGGARKVQRPGRREPRFPGPRFPVCEPGPLPPAWQAGCARRRRAFVTDEHARVSAGPVRQRHGQGQACERAAGS